MILAVVDAGFDEFRRKVSERMGGRVRLKARVEAIAAAHVEFFAVDPDAELGAAGFGIVDALKSLCTSLARPANGRAARPAGRNPAPRDGRERGR